MMILLFSFLATVASAQTKQQVAVPVVVTHGGDDSVGQRLAFALRQQIQRMPGYQLKRDRIGFTISLSSLDLALPGENQGDASAVSVAFLLVSTDGTELHLAHRVITVGSDRIDVMAQRILANFDQLFDTASSKR